MRQLNIKIFADGADLQSILNLAKDNRIKGFTTNPTLMKKAGVKDYKAFAKEVLKHVVDKPISFEVFSDELPEMERQAKEIASWADNVYVKIPITNTQGVSTAPVIKSLSHNNVKVNVTGVFTLDQTMRAAGVLQCGSPSVISVFAGRIADTGRNPTPIMKEALNICNKLDSNIELLWASPRELYNIIEADEAGCHIITVAHDILAKLNNLDKDLEEFSLETVRMFKIDSEKAGYVL